MSIGNTPTITVDDPLPDELHSGGLLSTGILSQTIFNKLSSANFRVSSEASLSSK